MLSYIVAIVAALLLLSNPISRVLFPEQHLQQQQRAAKLSPRPQLNESLLALDGPNSTLPDCPADTYAARILSREPLVVYLENFLSPRERKHLLDISEPIFEPSTVTHDASVAHRDTAVRDSAVALIPRTDTVRCIEKRARALQGWRRDVWIERLRTQRYVAGGHYSHHFDWSGNSQGWGRVSSFMVWVDATEGLQGGGTEFPLLRTRVADADDSDDVNGERKSGGGEPWCKLVECPKDGGDGRKEDEGVSKSDEDELGTVFKAIPGNAVYWENFAPDGRGYDETWHAGLPVKKGVKVGLNIWSFGRIE